MLPHFCTWGWLIQPLACYENFVEHRYGTRKKTVFDKKVTSIPAPLHSVEYVCSYPKGRLCQLYILGRAKSLLQRQWGLFPMAAMPAHPQTHTNQPTPPQIHPRHTTWQGHLEGTFAPRAQYPNECSGHLSQCFTPKHHSLLWPRNPKHKHIV